MEKVTKSSDFTDLQSDSWCTDGGKSRRRLPSIISGLLTIDRSERKTCNSHFNCSRGFKTRYAVRRTCSSLVMALQGNSSRFLWGLVLRFETRQGELGILGMMSESTSLPLAKSLPGNWKNARFSSYGLKITRTSVSNKPLCVFKPSHGSPVPTVYSSWGATHQSDTVQIWPASEQP